MIFLKFFLKYYTGKDNEFTGEKLEILHRPHIFKVRAGGMTPVPPGRGGGGSRMLRGLMHRQGKIFLGACRCMTVVV